MLDAITSTVEHLSSLGQVLVLLATALRREYIFRRSFFGMKPEILNKTEYVSFVLNYSAQVSGQMTELAE